MASGYEISSSNFNLITFTSIFRAGQSGEMGLYLFAFSKQLGPIRSWQTYFCVTLFLVSLDASTSTPTSMPHLLQNSLKRRTYLNRPKHIHFNPTQNPTQNQISSGTFNIFLIILHIRSKKDFGI